MERADEKTTIFPCCLLTWVHYTINYAKGKANSCDVSINGREDGRVCERKTSIRADFVPGKGRNSGIRRLRGGENARMRRAPVLRAIKLQNAPPCCIIERIWKGEKGNASGQAALVPGRGHAQRGARAHSRRPRLREGRSRPRRRAAGRRGARQRDARRAGALLQARAPRHAQ